MGPVPHGQVVVSLRVSWHQIWMELLVAGLAVNRRDGQLLDMLLTLLQQLSCERQYWPVGPKVKSNPSEVEKVTLPSHPD